MKKIDNDKNIRNYFSRIVITFRRYCGVHNVKGLGAVYYENGEFKLSEKIYGVDAEEVMAVLEANRAIIEEVDCAIDWDGMRNKACERFAKFNAYGKYGSTAGEKVDLACYYPLPLRAEGSNVFGVMTIAAVCVGV